MNKVGHKGVISNCNLCISFTSMESWQYKYQIDNEDVNIALWEVEEIRN